VVGDKEWHEAELNPSDRRTLSYLAETRFTAMGRKPQNYQEEQNNETSQFAYGRHTDGWSLRYFRRFGRIRVSESPQ
jgi:hypothetical protein